MDEIHNPNYIRHVKIHVASILDCIKSELLDNKYHLSKDELDDIEHFPEGSKDLTLGQKRYMQLLLHQEWLRNFLISISDNNKFIV